MTARIIWHRDWPAMAEAVLDGAGAHVWIGQLAVPPAAVPPEPTAGDLAEAHRRPAVLRAAFLGRRLLLRRFVAAMTGCPAAEVAVKSGGGRPSLGAPLQHLFVSTSSREGWVALALAGSPVGVDLELVGVAHEPAWTVLSRAEQANLRQRPPADRWPAFLALWTAKEAYLKAVGVGLSREPGTIDVAVRGSSLLILDAGRPAGTAAAERVSMAVPGGLVSAACVILPPQR